MTANDSDETDVETHDWTREFDAEEYGNDPERLEWFRDLGLGMFVNMGVDVQLGAVMSHSLVGASEDYVDRYIRELPATFNPTRFDPDEWIRLAKVAGMQYVVFDAKHHSGFALWETETTEFNVTNTPYGRDMTREVLDASRAHDVPVGLYFSPDDFWLLSQQGTEISRDRPEVLPTNNAELMEHNLAQVEELFTNYGEIDVLFIDGQPDGIKERAWELQPEVVVTRGSMATPEQELRDEPLDEAWEANLTIGSQWQYKPTNEDHKSGRELIEYLVETRAKGGNLLVNVGPAPDGTVPGPQQDRIRELGLWNFVNREAVVGTRPCPTIRESVSGITDATVWFTRADDEEPTTVYAMFTGTRWPRSAERRSITVESVRATEETEIELLGQSGRVFEYRPDVTPAASWTQDEDGLHISLMRAQRLYNADSYIDAPESVTWTNPPVIEITNAELVDD